MKNKLSSLGLWKSPSRSLSLVTNDLGSLAIQGLWPSGYIARQVAVFP